MSWLVVGIGNTLRRDDGLGPWIAERIRQMDLAEVSVRAVHQLTPELAAELAEHERVLFIDTSETELDANLIEIEASSEANPMIHALSPENLLALMRQLGMPLPRAWLATVRGCDFEFGEGLSEAAQAMAATLLPQLRSLLEKRCMRPA